MVKNVLIFGILLGVLVAGNMVYMVDQVCNNTEIQTDEVVGYAAMIVVFSLTFFGIRNYRNGKLNGFISFGQALKVGSLIVLVASTLYVVVWLFDYYLFVPQFIDQYTTHVLQNASRSGATDTELAHKTKQMVHLKEMYTNPVLIVLLSYSEVLPVGMAVAIVSSFLLKKKQKRMLSV